jgi:hypothetical protein
MARTVYDEDLIEAAQHLLTRREGQSGKLSQARIRRSVSTTYYALFHFLVEAAGYMIIGAHSDLRRRRRTFAREFDHRGMKTALEKVGGGTVHASVADLLRPQGSASGNMPSPDFAREMATAFLNAQAKRHNADYDLNAAMRSYG